MATIGTLTLALDTKRLVNRETTVDPNGNHGLIVVNCKKLLEAVNASDAPIGVYVDYVDNETLGSIGMSICKSDSFAEDGRAFIDINFLNTLAGKKALTAYTEHRRTIYLNISKNSIHAEIDT